MNERVQQSPSPIYSTGALVVSLRDVVGQDGQTVHPRGAVGIIVRSPGDLDPTCRVRFHDGFEAALHRAEMVLLAQYKESESGEVQISSTRGNLYDRVILRCVIGSRAYGLADDQSDTDYRGIFLPPAESHWSLHGVPEQLECQETQEHYWELQRFLTLALKANPNVLECLYSPLIEKMTPLASELLEMRTIFLSRLVYQTYNGYVLSQFKKMQADLRNQGEVKWKHVMHLIRLLISGIAVLKHGFVPVRVDEHRDLLLAIKRGEVPLEEIDKWRLSLHAEFDRALSGSKLPERPNYEQANALLVRARRAALSEELP
ncbi:DNA polymerase beta superfamily protein [Schlesneria sp. T3-172]|uniref:nucleotidyltransferase domain-containing protein n=1 Tax=Schlesneria TaxID=656899 RepID=UPI002F158C20